MSSPTTTDPASRTSGATPGAGGAARFQQVPDQAPRRPLVAAASALGLLALLVGVPAALVALGGVPSLPTSVDGGLLTARIGVEQVVQVLLVVVWLAWLQFAFCTVVEVVAALRGGVLAASVPLSGPVQRLARGLVAGLLLTATLGTQVGAGAVPPPAPTAVVAVDTGVRPSPLAPVGAEAGAMLWTEPAVDVTPDGDEAGRSVTVMVPTSVLGGAVDAQQLADLVGQKVYVVAPPQGRHHDSLWDIAERHLGDGRRYTEIHALNRGRVQPDGRSLELARLIQPGWYLVMPDDAVGVERMTAPTPVWPGSAGSSSSSSSGASDEVSGLGGGAGIVTDGASGALGGAGGLGGSGVVAGAPGPGVVDGVTAPGTAGESGIGAGDTGARPVPAPAPTATASDGADPLQVAGELGAAGLLGAGLLAALLAARRRGRPAAPPDAAVEAEVWLRAGADPGRARFVDTALRSLAAVCADEGTSFPDVYAVVADDDAVTLLLAPPRPTAPAPWTAAQDGAQWVLARGLLPRSTGHVGPPLPSLVGLGRDAAGRDVLVDLGAAAGPVSVTGDPVVAGHVARALAVELATNPWSRDVRVTGVDLPAGLSVVGGIDVPADPADPLAEVRARVAPSASDDVLTGPPDRDGRSREHVVLGRPPEHLVREDLRRLGAGGRLGVVVAGDVPGARWRFDVTPDGTLTVGELALAVTANRIGDATLARLGELFAAAAGAAGTAADGSPGGASASTSGSAGPGGATDPSGAAGDPAPFSGPDDGDDVRFYAHVPAPPHPTADGAWADAPARIGVLGPVVVRAPGALDAARVDLAAEVVAYLALHPQGAHPTVLAGAVWPRGVTADVRDATLARVTDWLGEGPAGPRLVVGDDERLRLGPEVAVDHHVLCELLRQAGRTVGAPAERDLLVRALSLVRGPLAGGVTGGSYSWLPRTGLERTVPQLVTAAAHRLAVLTLDDDPRAAGEAARCGLRADPCSQVVWRDLLRSEHAQWGADGARQAALQMREVLADLGAAPDALTEALVDDLCPGAGRQAVGGA